jgi:hypothetical protein
VIKSVWLLHCLAVIFYIYLNIILIRYRCGGVVKTYFRYIIYIVCTLIKHIRPSNFNFSTLFSSVNKIFFSPHIIIYDVYSNLIILMNKLRLLIWEISLPTLSQMYSLDYLLYRFYQQGTAYIIYSTQILSHMYSLDYLLNRFDDTIYI